MSFVHWQVYKSDKSASTESAPLKPWTVQAVKRLESEQRVQKTPNLKWVILRPAICYGPGDLTGLSQSSVAGNRSRSSQPKPNGAFPKIREGVVQLTVCLSRC
jgi:nucleoside-diphosphate-sugar epimerase